MLPFLHTIENEFEQVNARIIDSLHSDETLVENIGHYIVAAGGKRLRPILVLLSAASFAPFDDKHVELATIIEFIHTATLLHDDVVDLSQLRRGRATANAKWGNAPSVLVGDFLYSRSFQLMVGIGNMHIMELMAKTTNVIAEGEVQQLAHAKSPQISEEKYFEVIYKKTAALFEAACEGGAIIGGASADEREKMRRYGYHLGMAFQLVDDLLDYGGTTANLGKNVGDDLAEGKMTLPLIHALQGCSDSDADFIREAIAAGGSRDFERVLNIVQAQGSLDYTHTRAAEHVGHSLSCLEALSNSPYVQAMRDLANYSISRST